MCHTAFDSVRQCGLAMLDRARLARPPDPSLLLARPAQPNPSLLSTGPSPAEPLTPHFYWPTPHFYWPDPSLLSARPGRAMLDRVGPRQALWGTVPDRAVPVWAVSPCLPDTSASLLSFPYGSKMAATSPAQLGFLMPWGSAEPEHADLGQHAQKCSEHCSARSERSEHP